MRSLLVPRAIPEGHVKVPMAHGNSKMLRVEKDQFRCASQGLRRHAEAAGDGQWLGVASGERMCVCMCVYGMGEGGCAKAVCRAAP